MGLNREHPIFDLLMQLKSDGACTIDKMLEEQRAESLHLEFKQKSRPTENGLSDDDDKNIGKVLSAFSNSEGGVVIWGVRTGKVNGQDVAKTLVPINNIDSFANKLRELAAEWLSPRNSGIQIFPIATAQDTTKGFVVMEIPQGENRPYRSNVVGHKSYYQRTSTRIDELEHFQIADLFASNKSASLQVEFGIKKAPYTNDGTLLISFNVINSGAIGAEQPYVWFEKPQEIPLSSVSPFNYAGVASTDGRAKLFCPPSYILFPGDGIFAANFAVHAGEATLGAKLYLGAPRSTFDHEPKRLLPDCTIQVWVGSKNSNQKQFEFLMSSEDLMSKLRNK